jgi:hypothetical protein
LSTHLRLGLPSGLLSSKDKEKEKNKQNNYEKMEDGKTTTTKKIERNK